MLSGEELHRDLGADPRPLVHGQRVVTGVTLSRGEVLHALGNLEPESADVAAVHPVRGAQSGHGLVVILGQPGTLEAVLSLSGQRVVAGPEQQLHLLRSDLIPDGQALERGQA